MPLKQIVEGLSFVVLGIPLYFFIEFEYDEKFLIIFNELMAPLYNEIAFYLYPPKLRKKLLKDAIIKKGDVVLDIACHTGILIDDIAKVASRVIATDLSYADIDITRAKLSGYDKVLYVRCDPEYLPFKDSAFDRIVGFDVSDEAVNSEKLFSEINRVLAKNGRATIILFEPSFSIFTAPLQWRVEFIEDYLEKLGLSFRVKRIDTVLATGYMFKIRKEEKQRVERISDFGIFHSFYYYHIVRKLY